MGDLDIRSCNHHKYQSYVVDGSWFTQCLHCTLRTDQNYLTQEASEKAFRTMTVEERR